MATDVPLTNASRRVAMLERLRKAWQGREGWDFSQHNQVLMVTCRPRDEAFCRQALQP